MNLYMGRKLGQSLAEHVYASILLWIVVAELSYMALKKTWDTRWTE
jgi:hypothetical protein